MARASVAALLLATATLLGVPASAQDAALQPTTVGGVTFVSGGIGEDETQALRQMQSHYNLRLTFAVQGTGQYLADIPVRISNQRGQTILDTVSRGPRLLAQVPPGSYKISAEFDGQQTTKTVAGSSRGAASEAYFYWPMRESR